MIAEHERAAAKRLGLTRERAVRTLDGVWYLARMQPCRTLDNVIAGVVLTFVDISELREAAVLRFDAAQLARELAEGIVDTVDEPLIVLDGALQVVSASRSFCRRFQVTPEETVGRKIRDLGSGRWNIPALRHLTEDILPREQVLEDYVVKHEFPGMGPRRMVLDARRIATAIGNAERILQATVEVDPSWTS